VLPGFALSSAQPVAGTTITMAAISCITLLRTLVCTLRQATYARKVTAVSAVLEMRPPSVPPPEVRSAGGLRLAVRPMRPSDGDALATAFAALSPESRYQRFLAPKPRLTARDIAALTDVDHHAREALVAIDPAAGDWVAVARYAAPPADPAIADVAVTVADAWQGRGVGTALLGLLIERAGQEGIVALRATTLAANRPALRLLRRHGFEATGFGAGLVELARELSPALRGRRAPAL
jgi:RimJ/RimL family protein N-acetyltransferase